MSVISLKYCGGSCSDAAKLCVCVTFHSDYISNQSATVSEYCFGGIVHQLSSYIFVSYYLMMYVWFILVYHSNSLTFNCSVCNYCMFSVIDSISCILQFSRRQFSRGSISPMGVGLQDSTFHVSSRGAGLDNLTFNFLVSCRLLLECPKAST